MLSANQSRFFSLGRIAAKNSIFRLASGVVKRSSDTQAQTRFAGRPLFRSDVAVLGVVLARMCGVEVAIKLLEICLETKRTIQAEITFHF